MASPRVAGGDPSRVERETFILFAALPRCGESWPRGGDLRRDGTGTGRRTFYRSGPSGEAPRLSGRPWREYSASRKIKFDRLASICGKYAKRNQ